jgi:hypothetical protein
LIKNLIVGGAIYYSNGSHLLFWWIAGGALFYAHSTLRHGGAKTAMPLQLIASPQLIRHIHEPEHRGKIGLLPLVQRLEELCFSKCAPSDSSVPIQRRYLPIKLASSIQVSLRCGSSPLIDIHSCPLRRAEKLDHGNMLNRIIEGAGPTLFMHSLALSFIVKVKIHYNLKMFLISLWSGWFLSNL